jgi:UDP-glucose 4-epimerase
MMHEIKSTLRLRTRPKVDVFGTDYPTPDGTLHPRLYSHVRSRRAHSDALAYLRGGGESATLIAVTAVSPCPT